MNDTMRESLSALMDDEADDLELRRILKTLPKDGSLCETWKRYHLLSAGLRQEVHTRPGVDLLSGIHAALENEPAPEMPRERRPFLSVARYLGQGAIAASVAVVVLVTAESITNLEGSNNGTSSLAGASGNIDTPVIPATNGEFDPGELTRTASFTGEASPLDQEARDRLRQAVYREFVEDSDFSEIRVNYTPVGN